MNKVSQTAENVKQNFTPTLLMEKSMVSFYKNAHATASQPVLAGAVLADIQRGKYRPLIDRLRRLEDKTAYDDLKRKLPAVTWAGTFASRRKDALTTASGLFAIDLDHVADVTAVKHCLAQDSSLVFCFTSPGGQGVKAAFRVPPITNDAQFKAAFHVVKARVKAATGLSIDEARKDICGLCFVSYDADLFQRDDAETLLIDFAALDREQQAMPQLQPARRVNIDDKILDRWLSWKIDDALNIINQSSAGGLHAARLKAGNLLGGVVSGFGAGRFSEEDAFQSLWPAVAAKTTTPEQAEQDLRDGIEHGKTAPLSEMDMQAKFAEWQAQHPLESRAEHSDAPHPKESKKSTIQGGKANIIRAALKEYAFALNELTDRIMVNGDPLTDETLSVIYCDLVNVIPSCTTELLTHVIRAEAAQHRYHPIKAYLNGLQWNGANEIEKLARYFEDEDRVFGLYLRKWLIGAVAKAFTGRQNPVLVLVGEQGAGKGYFAKWLCPIPKAYIESPIIPDNNDNKLRLTDRFIWEVSELGSTTRRADVDALKWFLTLESVVARRSYGRFDIEKPALASFIGTVNPDGAGFLMDATGNRRFRPVTLVKIDRRYADACDISQVWAEAVDAYRRGETADLPASDESTLRQHILPKSQIVNIMVEMIQQEYIKLSDAAEDKYVVSAFSSTEILLHLYNCGYHGRNSKADAMDLAQAMQYLGFEKTRSATGRKYIGIIKNEK